ncbi:DNA-binding protein [Paraburkholderia sp. J94]|uniref:DNA-binding protein n=1 Tax=Paraburkholderia sp. J94 TaxID=2805441 RepID=UPI002AB0A43E|nr:DNA-binding protein [Paraburkholderia sp. J94]
MTTNQLAAITKNRPLLSTEELATLLTLRPQSIRKRYCQTGSYFCLRPVKLPNGRLMWPADSLAQLAEGQ